MNLELTPIAKAVDTWLDEVSYEADPSYIPARFALEFVTFIKLVNGGAGEENKTPVLHFKMLDQVGSGETRIANLVFRGAAKTTIMAEYMFLYLGVYGNLPGFGKVELALYVSDSIDNGVKNMRKNLQFRYDNSEFLKKYIPVATFTDIRWAFQNLNKNWFVVKGYGAKTGVRGSKEMGKRPRLAVLDDLLSDEDARSPTVIASIEDTVYKAVTFALHPERNMIVWSGTPFNAKDPLYKAVESGGWRVNVYPVCERFPCAREDFRGAWEDRFGYDYVKAQYEMAMKTGMVDTFNQELMLRIMSDEDRLIQDSEIGWYRLENVLKYKNRYNFYVTTDFAVSEKEAADNSVISVWAHNHNKDWLWVDGICKRQDMGANIDDLFRLIQMYKPQGVGIEVSGQQGGFIPWIQDQMGQRNNYFNLVSDSNSNKPGIRPTTNKMERFNTVVPLFKLHKIFFPVEKRETPIMQEAINELSLASAGGFKSKKDDFLDNISMLSVMRAWAPAEEATIDYNPETGLWETDDESDHSDRIASYII